MGFTHRITKYRPQELPMAKVSTNEWVPWLLPKPSRTKQAERLKTQACLRPMDSSESGTAKNSRFGRLIEANHQPAMHAVGLERCRSCRRRAVCMYAALYLALCGRVQHMKISKGKQIVRSAVLHRKG